MDNPSSFFVKQGTISNIVHFKPRDLLELVEECAGVNYYNGIRKHFDNVIDRQDRKMMSIEDIYNGDLHPEVLRLQKEVRVLGEFEQCQTELKLMKHYEAKLKKLVVHNKIEKLKENIFENRNAIKEIIKERRKAYEHIENLEAQVEILEKDLARAQDSSQHQKELERRQGMLAKKNSQIESLRMRTIMSKETTVEEMENSIARFTKIIERNETLLRVSTSKLETIRDGLKAKRSYLAQLESLHQRKGVQNKSKWCRLFIMLFLGFLEFVNFLENSILEAQKKNLEDELENITQDILKKEREIKKINRRLQDYEHDKKDMFLKITKFETWIQKKNRDIIQTEQKLQHLANEKSSEKRTFKDWDKLQSEKEKLLLQIRSLPHRLLENLELKFDEYKMRKHNFGKHSVYNK
jgi:chromosome segregation ATPase